MAARDGARGFLNRGLRVAASGVERGKKADGEADESGSDETEGENRAVNMNGRESRKVDRTEGDDGLNAKWRDGEAERAADECEEQTFCEHLADQTRATSAEGGAHCEFG